MGTPKDKEKTDLVPAQEPGVPAVFDYGDDEGSGFDNLGQGDYSIPFLKLLQSNSPEVADEDSALRPGMIMDTVTGASYAGKEGFAFLAVDVGHEYVEWFPKESNKGIAQRYPIEHPMSQKYKGQVGKQVLENGNELVETYYLYLMIVGPDGSTQPAVLTASSTKITPFKKFISRLRFITVPLPGGRKGKPPLWAHRARARSVKETNTQGDYYNYTFSMDDASDDANVVRLPPSDGLYQDAKAFFEAIRSGKAKVDENAMANAARGDATAAGEGTGSRADNNQEAPPF